MKLTKENKTNKENIVFQILDKEESKNLGQNIKITS